MGLIAPPDVAQVDLQVISTVTDQNLERPLVVTDITFSGGFVDGIVGNIGGDEVVVARALVAGHDDDGRVLWVDEVYLPRSLLPTTSRGFSVSLPESSDLKVLDVPIRRQGREEVTELESPTPRDGLFPGAGSYASFTLRVDAMGVQP